MNLPEGWKRHVELGKIMISWPGKGHVTINYERRGFSMGWGSSIPHIHTAFGVYSGRGWREKLEADAIAALKETFKDEK